LTPAPDSAGAWPAPAKLNLMLRVLGRRPDGYHLLQTVFQFLDRADRLYFSVRDDGIVARPEGIDEIPPEQDLIVRAARALQAYSGCALGADIRCDKQLPMGGGLGGGSSDAATTLHALNHLWGLGLEASTLARLGLGLGADVPVFVHGHAAWGEGVGEELQPIVLPEPWYLVLVPPCQVSTAAVFGDPELTRDSPPVTIADFVAGDARNDCLSVVLSRYAEVREAFQWLDQRADARLTGTGACVFAALETRAEAVALLGAAPTRYTPFIARGCNLSPLAAA